ncbi:MAG: hypothetical protein AAB414_00425 [Patescibacteria group bacterium]
MDVKSLVLMIDILGIGVGLTSLWVIISTSTKVGGQVGSSFNFVLLGILFQMAAIIYTIIFTRLKLLSAPALDIHHALMVIGLILFVVAAKKFSDLSR